MFCLKCGGPVKPSATEDVLEVSYPELQRSLSEALARERATGEILRVIGSSPTDAQPVFETIARSGVSVCPALGCAVFVVDGDMLRVAATHGVRPERVERFRAEYPIPLSAEIDTAQTVRERSVFHLADIARNPNASASDIENARLARYRTRLMVPMVRGDRALGLIAVTRESPTPFSDQQVELLKTFAEQAVTAIENVRLFNETREALEQQTATSEILRVISSSPTDIQPVLEAVAVSAARVCGATDAVILRVEGQETRRVAHSGAIPLILPEMRRITPGSPGGRAILECRSIHVHDAFDTDFARDYPETAAVVRDAGWRTILVVPLVREGVAIGVISIRRTEVRPFTDKETALLQTFADQAVIAIENVRLFKELERKNQALTQAHAQVTEALEQQTATSEILRVISRSPTDSQPVFDAIARNAVALCGGIAAVVLRFDGEMLHVAGHHALSPQGVERNEQAYPRRLGRDYPPGRALLDRSVVHVPDLQAATEFAASTARQRGAGSQLAVPLLHDGEAIGVIGLARDAVGPFSPQQIEVLQTFADQAVIAIENVRLFKELEARNRDLTATSEVLQVISRSPTDVHPVFDTILANAARLCDAHRGALLLFRDGVFETRAELGTPVGLSEARKTPYRPDPHSHSLLARIVVERRAIFVPDLTAHQAYEEREPRTVAAVELAGSRSMLAVPLLKEDVLIGAITSPFSRPSRTKP